MSGRRPSPAEVARALRQRIEMGGGEIFLGQLDRAGALRLARAAPDRNAAPARDIAPDNAAAPDRGADRPGRGRRQPAPLAHEPPATSMVEAAAPLTHDAPAGPTDDDASRIPGAEAPPVPTGAAPTTPSPAAAADPAVLPVLPGDYDALRDTALACTRCRLSESRTQVVFSDGPPNARVMVVGEAPGAHEDEQGLPFVGAAGKFLDLLLATVGLSRSESVYICNVLKCRPPGNRNPLPDEIATCAPYLRKQIEVVRPEVILAVGSFAGQLLTGREKSALGRLRGEVHAYEGVPLVVTYHPAALLRNAGWTRAFWDDLQLLRSIIDR